MKHPLYFTEGGDRPVQTPRPHKARAFTLIELLVVMAIILIVAGVTLPGLKGSFDGINLSGASDVVVGQFLAARQAAVSRNLAVEVRVYNTGTDTSPVWNTIALVIPTFVSGSKVDEWLGTPQTLPGNVVFDPRNSSTGDSFSTIISPPAGSANNAAPTIDPTTGMPTNPPGPWKVATQTGASSAPRSVRGYAYVAFRYQPDGTTNLPLTTTGWCLTLRGTNARAATTAQFPAANYAALVLDPLNGRISSYRP